MSEDAVFDVIAEADARFPLETGGVLMGWRDDAGDIAVKLAIGPGPNANHDSCRFYPDGDWTDAEVARIYAASGRLVTYVGDWHTHPRGLSRPSPTDVATLGKIAANPEARCSHPVMLIAGGATDVWTLMCWELRRRRFARDTTRSVPHRTWRP